ncbi:hypothetical protein TELCIR_11971, partial [Teladorsagia circumcincta]
KANLIDVEFSKICHIYLGKPGAVLALVFSIMILVGAILAYFVLMSNFIYFSGTLLYEIVHPTNHTIAQGEGKCNDFNRNFPALTGMLTMSYFIHNAIITMLRNQRNPENNIRDLSIGYGLVGFSYIFVALAFYAAFPLPRSCIADKADIVKYFGDMLLLDMINQRYLPFLNGSLQNRWKSWSVIGKSNVEWFPKLSPQTCLMVGHSANKEENDHPPEANQTKL